MNEKFHVPFDTAILLRKKRYNNKVDYYYLPNGEICLAVITEVSNDTLDYENNRTIAAPTYHEVLDWLQGKGIYITCYAPLSKPVGRYAISVFNSNTNNINDWGLCRDVYPTREEAINDGILKALEML
jgi:hypothetical protein